MANEVVVAQNQNLAVTNDKLIKDRPEDLFLVNISSLKKKKLTTKRIEELEKTRRNFIEYYYRMAYSHYELGPDQLAV